MARARVLGRAQTKVARKVKEEPDGKMEIQVKERKKKERKSPLVMIKQSEHQSNRIHIKADWKSIEVNEEEREKK